MSKFSKMMDSLVYELIKNNSELVEEIINGDYKDHKFDETSDMCKKCKGFDSCKIKTSVKKKIEESEFSDGVKKEMIKFIGWINHEFKTVKIFNIEKILNTPIDEANGISAFYRRFRNADNHLDKLVAICNDEELSYIRKVIIDVNNKINELLETIMNDNREETNNLINQLQKPQQESKRYEDMTREELLEELKKEIRKTL